MTIQLAKHYLCLCLDASGNKKNLTITADDYPQLSRIISEKHLSLVQVTSKNKLTLSLSKHKPAKVVLRLTRQIAMLLQTNIPIANAFEFLIQTETDKKTVSLLQTILSKISNGALISEALADHKRYFNGHYCAIVNASETTGSLDQAFVLLAHEIEHSNQIKSKIKKALYYPSSLLLVTMAVSYSLIGYILPKFNALFLSFNKNLPSFTLFLMSASTYIKSLVPLFALFLLILAPTAWILFNKFPNFRYQSQQLLLNTPIIGKIINLSLTITQLRILGNALNSHLSIIDGLHVCQQSTPYLPCKNRLIKAIHLINAGDSIYNAFLITGLFNNQTLQLIAAAEHSNHLANTFLSLTRHTEQEFNNRIDHLQKLIEPLIILILSGIIGSVVIAIYLPIFNMGNIM